MTGCCTPSQVMVYLSGYQVPEVNRPRNLQPREPTLRGTSISQPREEPWRQRELPQGVARPQESNVPKNTHIRTDWPAARYRVEPTPTRRSALRSLGQVVYAVQINGLIKIGHTVDLDHRLRNYRAQLGETQLLCFVFGDLVDERVLHSRFRPHRAKGREWYYPTPEILDWINTNRQQLGREPVAS